MTCWIKTLSCTENAYANVIWQTPYYYQLYNCQWLELENIYKNNFKDVKLHHLFSNTTNLNNILFSYAISQS